MSEESNPLSPPLIESASALNASTKDTRFAEILSHAWACRQLLSINNRQLFDCSLAAFYSAKRSEHKSPTISAIAYVAAIGALSKKKRRRCKGKVSCADCGPLPLAHDLVGDRAAITELLLEAIGYAPSSGEGKFLSHVVRRVYSHQRSSYVHDAILRHSEEVLGGGSFAAMPRDGDPIASSLLAKNDLIVLSQAAQRTLLWWLFNSANPPGHIEFGQFEPLRLSGEIEVTAPGHSTVFINEGSGVRFRSASGDGEIRASMSIMDAVSNFASKTNSSQSY